MNLGSKWGNWGFGWGCASIGVVFFYPPNPSQQNHVMHPHPKRRKEKEPNKLPHPSFETTPQPMFTKMHLHMQLVLPLTLTLTLTFFFLHLPSSPFLIFKLPYFWDQHHSIAPASPSPLQSLFLSPFISPLSLPSLSLSLISLVFLSEFFLWIVSLSQWIGGWFLKLCSWSPPP